MRCKQLNGRAIGFEGLERGEGLVEGFDGVVEETAAAERDAVGD